MIDPHALYLEEYFSWISFNKWIRFLPVNGHFQPANQRLCKHDPISGGRRREMCSVEWIGFQDFKPAKSLWDSVVCGTSFNPKTICHGGAHCCGPYGDECCWEPQHSNHYRWQVTMAITMTCVAAVLVLYGLYTVHTRHKHRRVVLDSHSTYSDTVPLRSQQTDD